MSTIRRLLSLCLMLAFASYGAVVAAPAHAHGEHDGGRSALHAVAVDVGSHDDDHGHADDHGLGADEHSDDHHKPGEEPMHGGFHVHAVSAFTAVDEPFQVSQPATTTVMTWVERSSVDVSGLFSPLKKPPRIFL